jgi:hypothetical protein
VVRRSMKDVHTLSAKTPISPLPRFWVKHHQRLTSIHPVNQGITIKWSIERASNLLVSSHAPSPCLPARPVVVAELGWSEFQLR